MIFKITWILFKIIFKYNNFITIFYDFYSIYWYFTKNDYAINDCTEILLAVYCIILNDLFYIKLLKISSLNVLYMNKKHICSLHGVQKWISKRSRANKRIQKNTAMLFIGNKNNC